MNKSNQNIKDEYDRAIKVLKPIFLPFNRFVQYIDKENIIQNGPNLIIANHPGNGRDIAGIISSYNRQLHFLTAHYLFDESIFLNEYIKKYLGKYLYPFSIPFAVPFAKYLAKKLNRFEMIPINRSYDGDKKEFTNNIRNSIEKVKENLLKNRAVVIFQVPIDLLKTIGKKVVSFKEHSIYHHYIPKFNPTVSKIVFELHRDHNLLIPVSPISVYGAEGLNPFRKMVFNFGAPMDISSSLNSNLNENPIIDFTIKLEKKIAELLIESGLPNLTNK